jgi:predicted metal-dependent enzyme (double-stranded beta helix superfamily)
MFGWKTANWASLPLAERSEGSEIKNKGLCKEFSFGRRVNMSVSSRMPSELLGICTAWSAEMETLTDKKARIGFIQQRLPDLLLNTPLFEELVERMTKGDSYPDIRHTDAFDNEILLYLSPKRIFSLRMFLFGPGDFTPIHDHNSWGVTGTASNELTVVKYHRDDDESVEGYAKLHENRRVTLLPGATEITMPLNEGIHQTGNLTQDPMIMVSVYGSPIRRLYVNGFDMEKNCVFKMYAPRLKKKILARQVLKSIQTKKGIYSND